MTNSRWIKSAPLGALAAALALAAAAGAEPQLVPVGLVYGEIHDKADLQRVFSLIRTDVGAAQTRADLTRLYRRARYLVTLTFSPGWRRKFGQTSSSMTEAAKRELATTVQAINHRATEIGTEPDYGE